MSNPVLLYFHDPMCSWCWGFKKTWEIVKRDLPTNIQIKYVLGGLAPDTDTPMPLSMQNRIKNTWHQIQQDIPGTRFNFDFWTQCNPRRSTYASCRAVLAASIQDKGTYFKMLDAIQEAYYLRALNPSDKSTLVTLAEEIGLDPRQFALDIDSDAVESMLTSDISFCRKQDVSSFPALVLADDKQYFHIHIDYTHPEKILDQVISLL